MEGHGEADGPQEPNVVPGGHTKQRLVLRQTLERREREKTFTPFVRNLPRANDPPATSLRRPHLFRALHISMVTRTDRAMVMGYGDSNTWQSRPSKSGLSGLHWRKWLCGGGASRGVREGRGPQEAETGHRRRRAGLTSWYRVIWGPSLEIMNHQAAAPTVPAPT